MFSLVDASGLFNSKFYSFIRSLSDILMEPSYDLRIIAKQLELVHPRIQHTAIGWI